MSELIFGLKVAVIGMGVTFIGLVILIGLVSVNRFIAESVNKASGNKNKHDEVEKAPTAKPVAVAKPAVEPDNKGTVVAAITAAISVVMQGTPFKVKSVKKVQNTAAVNSWDMVAIQEQNNNL